MLIYRGFLLILSCIGSYSNITPRQSPVSAVIPANGTKPQHRGRNAELSWHRDTAWLRDTKHWPGHTSASIMPSFARIRGERWYLVMVSHTETVCLLLDPSCWCLPALDPGCWWCDDARVKRFWCPGPGPGSAPLQGRVSVPGWGESRLVPAQRHISATAWTQLQHSHSSQLYTATADQSARGLKSPAVHIKSPRTYSVLKYTE